MRYLVMFLLNLFSINGILSANTYQKGYQSYVSADYVGAESALKKALSAASSDTEAAKIYKLLGISQYMQGKRIEAAESFKEAKKKNPAITIAQNEVLDESVLTFFAGIESVKTSILLKVNPTQATAFLDGKSVPVNESPLPLSAGIHELEIQADGYKSLKQPIKIKAGIVNVIKVNLASEKQIKKNLPINKDTHQQLSNQKNKEDIQKILKPKKQEMTFQSFMPFGFPQFGLSQTFLGVSYAALQLGAIGFGLINYNAANQLVIDTNSAITEKENYRDTLKTRKEQEAYTDEINLYKDQQDAKVNQMIKTSSMAFAGFGLIWGISVLHAMLSFPSDTSDQAVLFEKKQSGGSYLLVFEPIPSIEKKAISFGLAFQSHF